MSTELPEHAKGNPSVAAQQAGELQTSSPLPSASRVSDIQQALWQFSLAFYPKQQSLLLRLQDELAAQVNVILAICWLVTQQRQLNSAQLQNCLAQIATTQQTLIQPLRNIRRSLTPKTLHFKAELLALELKAEQQEQAEIAAYLAENWPHFTETNAAIAPVQRYLTSLARKTALTDSAPVDLDQAIASYLKSNSHSLI